MRLGHRGEDGLFIQRNQAARVYDLGGNPILLQRFGGLERLGDHIADRNNGDI